jgi:hypothetical protein
MGQLAPPTHWCEQDPHDARRLGFHLACGWSGVVDLAGGGWGGGGGGGGRPFVTHAHCPPPPWEISAEDGTRRLARGVDAAALSHRRSAAWVTVGGGGTGGAACAALAVGCPGVAGLRLLDFSPTPAARHWVAGVHAADLEAEEEEAAAAAAAGLGDDDDNREGASGASGGMAMDDMRYGGSGGGGGGGGGASEQREQQQQQQQQRRRMRSRVRATGRWWPEEPVALSGPALAVAAHPWAPDHILAGSWGSLCLVEHR